MNEIPSPEMGQAVPTSRATARFKFLLPISWQAVHDVVVSMIPQVVRVATGFVTSVLIARGLGPAGLGQYALIMSLTETAGQISDLGIGQTAVRYASQAAARGDTDRQLAILRWALRLRLLLVLLTGAVLFGLATILANHIWRVESLAPLIRFSLLTALFGVLSSVPMVYFQSLRRFGMNAAVLTGQSLVSFGCILVVAWLNRWSVLLVIAASVLASGLGAVSFLLLVPKGVLRAPGELRKLFRSGPLALLRSPTTTSNQPSAVDASEPDRFAFYMLLSTVIVMLTLRADVWLMGVFLTEDQIGIYSAAMRITLPLAILLNALNTALWPRASALTGVHETVVLLRKTFRVSAIAAGVGVLYAATAPLLVPLLFGADYTDSAFLGQLLSLRYCLSLLTCPIGVIGYSFGLVRVYWLINFIQLIVVVSINGLLLLNLGPVGAALALIGNDLVGFVLMGLLLRQKVISLGSQTCKV